MHMSPGASGICPLVRTITRQWRRTGFLVCKLFSIGVASSSTPMMASGVNDAIPSGADLTTNPSLIPSDADLTTNSSLIPSDADLTTNPSLIPSGADLTTNSSLIPASCSRFPSHTATVGLPLPLPPSPPGRADAGSRWQGAGARSGSIFGSTGSKWSRCCTHLSRFSCISVACFTAFGWRPIRLPAQQQE